VNFWECPADGFARGKTGICGAKCFWLAALDKTLMFAGMPAVCIFLLTLVAASSLHAAEPSLKRYLYMSTPDGAQAQGASGAGILMKDQDGKLFASSKFFEVHWRDGKVVQVGNEFGLGRAHWASVPSN